MHFGNKKRYLEGVVCDVTDIYFFTGTSVWTGGGQK